MPSRLTELLERIRPAGAPGAAATGEQATDTGRDIELADVAAVLAEFEAEVDDIEADAHARTREVRREADRTAESITAEIPDRVAVARAEAARDEERRGHVETARLTDEARRDADRRRAAALAGLDDLVASAVARIWALTEDEDGVAP